MGFCLLNLKMDSLYGIVRKTSLYFSHEQLDKAHPLRMKVDANSDATWFGRGHRVIDWLYPLYRLMNIEGSFSFQIIPRPFKNVFIFRKVLSTIICFVYMWSAFKMTINFSQSFFEDWKLVRLHFNSRSQQYCKKGSLNVTKNLRRRATIQHRTYVTVDRLKNFGAANMFWFWNCWTCFPLYTSFTYFKRRTEANIHSRTYSASTHELYRFYIYLSRTCVSNIWVSNYLSFFSCTLQSILTVVRATKSSFSSSTSVSKYLIFLLCM